MSFSEDVYALCKQIPIGKVATYKSIAEKLGTKAYQAIGQVLKRNSFAPEVPCHRVVSSDGSLGGFRGELNCREKVKLLKEEGIIIKDNRIDLQRFGFK